VFVTTVYEMLFGGLILLVVGRISGESFTGHYSARTWLALAYLVVFGSVLAFTAYVWLLDSAPISLVATYAYVNPVVAVFLGWLVLSEHVTVPILVGGAIVVLSVAIVIASERPSRASRASAESAEREPVTTPSDHAGPSSDSPL
jgi:drug/metabolite transporter (DMT)-like permease